MSSPELKNISLLSNTKSALQLFPSRPTQRGVGHRHNEGRVAVDARVALDARSSSVRQRRVVLTPRCWRPCTWEAFDFPGRNGGKRAVLRGELVISRKAIAQGMSDVLRCPVCSCAHFPVHIARETAGAARIRHSLRLLNWRGREDDCKPRTPCAARRRTHIQCRPGLDLRCATAHRGTHNPRE